MTANSPPPSPDQPCQSDPAVASPGPETQDEVQQAEQPGLPTVQQLGVFALGFLILAGAVIAIWITWGSGASWMAPKPQTSGGRQIPAALRAEKFPACPMVPATFLGGANDGRFPLLAEVSGLIAADIASFGVVGRESAAAGRNRDAEVAYLMSCRVADELNGAASLESADARYQLANHYAKTAVSQNSPGTNQHELLSRAEELYAASARIYAANFGDAHERSRFAVQGLSGVQQKLAEAGSSPATSGETRKPDGQLQVAKAPAVVAPSPSAKLRESAVSAIQDASVPVPVPDSARAGAAPITPTQPPPQIIAKARSARPAPAPASTPVSVAAAPTAPPAPPIVAAPEPPTQTAVATQLPAELQASRVETVKAQPAPRADPGRAVAIRASFDCSKANSAPERMICSDAQLARMDRDLARVYGRAKNAATDRAAFRRQQEREWFKRESTCRDRDCLLRWYSNRRAQLMDIIENRGPQSPAASSWDSSESGQISDMRK